MDFLMDFYLLLLIDPLSKRVLFYLFPVDGGLVFFHSSEAEVNSFFDPP